VLQADIEHLAIAAQGVSAEGVFMTASSPGAIALRAPSSYYASQEDYLAALADALREEYEAIHAAGFLLQVDCPDLATRAPGAETTGEFRHRAALAVEALNHALSAIPAGSVRMHVCGGSPDLPGTTEAELGDIIDILLRARPAGLMLMAAGSHHAQDWKVFTETELPHGKYLVPGVLDSQTSLVEQPEAIADLLTCYALTVGPERMMAGAGCGFGSPAGNGTGTVPVTWAKFRSLAEGARLASERLWSKVPA
jgi:5-methyltetrahydropteroyltriglutamate--homocysteine methyltransferase